MTLDQRALDRAIPWWLAELRAAGYDLRRVPADRRAAVIRGMIDRGIEVDATTKKSLQSWGARTCGVVPQSKFERR